MPIKAKQSQRKLQAQGRRVVPAVRRRAARAAAKGGTVTLGDLIAAAYDTVGPDVGAVERVLSSPEMACAIRRRIVIG